MRHNITKNNSSRAERIIYEMLKELKIPFKHRWIISGREVDFIVGNTIIEINGHGQDHEKNLELVQLGYVPIHFHNKDVFNNRESIKDILNKL